MSLDKLMELFEERVNDDYSYSVALACETAEKMGRLDLIPKVCEKTYQAIRREVKDLPEEPSDIEMYQTFLEFGDTRFSRLAVHVARKMGNQELEDRAHEEILSFYLRYDHLNRLVKPYAEENGKLDLLEKLQRKPVELVPQKVEESSHTVVQDSNTEKSEETDSIYRQLMEAIQRMIEMEEAELNYEIPESFGEARDQILAILSDVDEKTEMVRGTSLGVDPRKKFRKIIDIASKAGNPAFLDNVCDRIIGYYEAERYNFEAAQMAIEFSKLNKAKSLIEKLITSESNPDYSGAEELGKMVGGYFLEDIRDRIAEVKRKKDEKAKEKAGQLPPLPDNTILTANSKYQINKEGFIFKNGEPLIFEHQPFKYLGIVDAEEAWDRINGDRISEMRSQWSIGYLLHKIYQEKRISVKTVPFSELSDSIDGNNAIVGINKDEKKLYMTSPIKSVE